MKRVPWLAAVVLMAAAAMAQTTVPAGTAFRVKLSRPLSSAVNKAGDKFSAELIKPIIIDGQTVIPSGAMIEARVTGVSEPRRIAGKPSIGIHPEKLMMAEREPLAIDATLVDTSLRDGSSVNEEGQFKGSGRTKKDMIIIAGGTGTGMLIGGLAGGGVGVGVGAAVGAGAGTTKWLASHHSADIPAGTELFIELNRPLSIAAAEPALGQ